jgi:hypothetical protein
MKHCYKVKFQPNLKYMNKATVLLRAYGKSSEEADAVLKRYYIPTRQEALIRQALPLSLQTANIAVSRTTIDLTNFENNLKPHVHMDEKCVLNYYMLVSGEETSFWEGAIEQDDNLVIDNGNQYYMVKTDNLTKVEQFYAKNGDAWLLNTQTPHQISCDAQEKIRDFVQVYFIDLSIDEVKTHFEVLE